jgi:hypothetical protein
LAAGRFGPRTPFFAPALRVLLLTAINLLSHERTDFRQRPAFELRQVLNLPIVSEKPKRPLSCLLTSLLQYALHATLHESRRGHSLSPHIGFLKKHEVLTPNSLARWLLFHSFLTCRGNEVTELRCPAGGGKNGRTHSKKTCLRFSPFP